MTKGYSDNSRTAEPTDAEVLDAAYQIVSSTREFFIADPPGEDIIDDAALPFAKAAIVSAFRLVIATEPRAETRGNLMVQGSLLAQYQHDVGARISVTPVNVPGQEAIYDGWCQSRLDRLFDRVAVDRRLLRELYGKASRVAAQNFERARVHPPFQEDGTYTPYGHGNMTPRPICLAVNAVPFS